MRGFITHTYNPKIITAYTTSLNNIPNTRGFSPYCPNILDNHAYLLLTFIRFPTTAAQSSSKDIRIRLSCLNNTNEFSGLTRWGGGAKLVLPSL